MKIWNIKPDKMRTTTFYMVYKAKMGGMLIGARNNASGHQHPPPPAQNFKYGPKKHERPQFANFEIT